MFPSGSWKSLTEMEEELTLEELVLLSESLNKSEHRRNKFMAALKGIDLDEDRGSEDFERIKQRADAALAGKTEEEFVFDSIGFELESDD